jgi:tungstate transport system substrate-binding protein
MRCPVRKLSPMQGAALTALVLTVMLSIAGCSGGTANEGEGADPSVETSEIILSSTTSTEDSGLFAELIPAFEGANPEYKVKVIAVGTGEALQLARNGDADVVLAHAKSDEEKLVTDGVATERRDVMYNDFVIVGPANDPAGVGSASDIGAAMKAIEASGKGQQASFISRGDDSGTHKKELKLWSASAVTTPTPEAQEWYESTGSGMGDTLKIASDKQGYTLADRATYLSMKDALDLEIIREGDKDLLNQYGVLVVKDAKNEAGGQAFFDWILSEEAQEFIGGFGVAKYGEPLFIPNAQ